MKTNVSSFLKLTLILLLIMGACTYVRAQKKEIQAVNLEAPESLKIDGKVGEWGDDFQAYNKTTKLFYTMANDDKNLYLVVKAKDKLTITKILGGGISLTINTAGKKKDKDAFVITFPVVNRTSLRDARGAGGGRQGRGGFGGNGATLTPVQIDSASRASHKTALALIREIGVVGFKDITDSVISIYNEYSIKAAAGFDEEDSFVSELAIPLKLLNISPANAKELAYNIKVNGVQGGGGRNGGNRNGGGDGGGFGGGGNRGGGGFGGGGGGGENRGGGGGNRGGGNDNGISPMEELTTATDFWGKYTLYKK